MRGHRERLDAWVAPTPTLFATLALASMLVALQMPLRVLKGFAMRREDERGRAKETREATPGHMDNVGNVVICCDRIRREVCETVGRIESMLC